MATASATVHVLWNIATVMLAGLGLARLGVVRACASTSVGSSSGYYTYSSYYGSSVFHPGSGFVLRASNIAEYSDCETLLEPEVTIDYSVTATMFETTLPFLTSIAGNLHVTVLNTLSLFRTSSLSSHASLCGVR